MDGVNTFFVSWGARTAGLKVALSGLGGDELFGGYPSFRAAPYLTRLLAIARRLPQREREPISRTLLEFGRRGGHQSRSDRLRKSAAIFSHPEELPHAYFFSRLLFTPRQTERLLSPSIVATYREVADLEAASSRRRIGDVDHHGDVFGKSVVLRDCDIRIEPINS